MSQIFSMEVYGPTLGGVLQNVTLKLYVCENGNLKLKSINKRQPAFFANNFHVLGGIFSEWYPLALLIFG